MNSHRKKELNKQTLNLIRVFRSLLVNLRKVYLSNNLLESAIEKDTIFNNKYNKVVRINLQGMKKSVIIKKLKNLIRDIKWSKE